MKLKICYFAVTAAFALTTGLLSDVHTYTYQVKTAEGDREHTVEIVWAPPEEIVQEVQKVDVEAVHKAQGDADRQLIENRPGKWDHLFQAELAKIEKDLQEGKDIWTAFPTYAEDPKSQLAILCQIVEAEAGTEDLIGKTMVADVVLNRIDAGFGDSVSEVVFAEGQFDPVANGFFYMVSPSESTKQAVYQAISGTDYSWGSLYFCTPSSGYAYFSSFLTLVRVYGGHVFFK